MMSRHNLRAVDMLLRSLCNTPDTPFGGKIFIIAGDFHQIGPVVLRRSHADAIACSIKTCPTFAMFQHRALTYDLRVQGDPSWSAFDKGLGDGQG